MLQLVPPGHGDPSEREGHIDPRDPEVFRGGLASARAALRDGVTRRYRHDHSAGVDGRDGSGDRDT